VGSRTRDTRRSGARHRSPGMAAKLVSRRATPAYQTINYSRKMGIRTRDTRRSGARHRSPGMPAKLGPGARLPPTRQI
jgi:hypothetical protein